MEQFFTTTYPNYLAESFGKSSKTENGIIDKYLESRMKARLDSKSNNNRENNSVNMNNSSNNNYYMIGKKAQKDLSNFKLDNDATTSSKTLAATSKFNMKSKPGQQISNMLDSLRQTNSFSKSKSSNMPSAGNVGMNSGNSNEFYNFVNGNSAYSSDNMMHKDNSRHSNKNIIDTADDDDSVFGVNFKDSVENDEILGKEDYISDHKYINDYKKEQEKADEKDTVSAKASEDQLSWDINDKVARILKLVQMDEGGPADNGKYSARYSSAKGPRSAGYMENIEIWAGQEDRYSYYVFFVMIITIAIGAVLRSANRLLASVKIFIDMAFVSCWNWAKGVLSPSENNDGNLLIFVLCTPILAFLLILYAGFSIVYFANRALLSRVPDKIAEQVNLKKIKELNS